MFDSNETTPERSALVATFPDRDSAHAAASRLHDEGFHKTWVGLTRPGNGQTAEGEPAVEEGNAFSRFFGGGNESLGDALQRHGVSSQDATHVENSIPTNSAVLTVQGSNHPELAAEIIATCGGSMIASNASDTLQQKYGRRASFEGFGGYGNGEELGRERILELREERLSVDKKRVDAGEAVVGKRVVSERAEVDVPLVREELYIERRPATARDGEDVGEIDDGETIHVPLSREELDVTKRVVATEDVVIGQRQVTESRHVSETLRKEELDVDDDTVADRSADAASSIRK